MKLSALFENDKIYNDFDEWKAAMKERGCDHLEQENELTKIHIYALKPDGRTMGIWHRPQEENKGVCYHETEGRSFDKRGRKFKHLEDL